MISKPFQNIFSEDKRRKKQKQVYSKKIIIDHREKNSLVPTKLMKKGINIEFEQLKVADYIIEDVAVERKTFQDLTSSMINKRIFSQLEELKQYPRPLLIIEGYDNQTNLNVNINAIRSFILSIALRYKIPLIFTEDSSETADYLEILSRKKSKEVSLNVNKKNLTKNQELQFILESFKGIGPKTARKILESFKSLKEIGNSSQEELKNIIGKKSKTFFETLNREYKQNQD